MMYDWLYNLTGNSLVSMFIVSLLPLLFLLPFALFAVLAERKVSAHYAGPTRTNAYGLPRNSSNYCRYNKTSAKKKIW